MGKYRYVCKYRTVTKLVAAGIRTYWRVALCTKHRVLADVPPVRRRRVRALYEARDGRLAHDPLGERHREDLQVGQYVH